MTKNLKYFIGMLLIILLLCLIPNVVSAYEDTFTTEDGITVKKVVNGYTQGDLHFDISNITLDSEKGYSWGVSKASNVDSVENWYGLNDFTSSQKVATIDMLASNYNSDIGKFVKTNDIAYLFIKRTEDNYLVINALQIDLLLPIGYTFRLTYYKDYRIRFFKDW